MAAGSIFPHWQLSIHPIVLQILFYLHHRLREKKMELEPMDLLGPCAFCLGVVTTHMEKK